MTLIYLLKVFFHVYYFKSLYWIYYNITSLLCLGFFGEWGILAPQPGIEPTPSALEGKVLITGLPTLAQFSF